jgi:HNH endonuclease
VSDTGCWEWMGCRIWNGYGRVRNGSHPVLAHRRVYEILVGKIPEGMVLDHVCNNRPCVNPAHLRVSTGKDNVLRGTGPTAVNYRKTHCNEGHLLVRGKRQRVCPVCMAIRQKENHPGPIGHPPATHCRYGHEYTEKNTYVYRGRVDYPYRMCRTCHRLKEQRRRANAANQSRIAR